MKEFITSRCYRKTLCINKELPLWNYLPVAGAVCAASPGLRTLITPAPLFAVFALAVPLQGERSK